MLQWMRNAQTWVIKGVLLAVVLAFVVTIFYQWGVQFGRWSHPLRGRDDFWPADQCTGIPVHV